MVQRWFSFEEEVRLLVEQFGYTAVCTPKSGDHGVDVIAEKNGRKVAVQVKLHDFASTGNKTITTLLGGMHVYGASEALFITTGRLTKKAIEACSGAKVAWYDGRKLRQLCIENALTLPSWCFLQGQPMLNETAKSILFGRDLECTVRIQDDMTVSRKHARLDRNGLALVLSDLQSTNGTLVNGTLIQAPYRLKYGDHFAIGNRKWLVRTSHAETMDELRDW
jgi:hypothetical protein